MDLDFAEHPVCDILSPVNSSRKLSIAFSITAVFLLAVGIAALVIIAQLTPLLDELVRLNRHLQQVAEATRSLRSHPDQMAQNLPWLEDLLHQPSQTDPERHFISDARRLLLEDRTVTRTLEKLEELQRHNREATAATHARLLVLHQRAVLIVTFAIAEAATLLVLLMFLVRAWLVSPLEEVSTFCQHLADGDLDHPPPSLPSGEHAVIVQLLTRIGAVLQAGRERMAHLERMAAVGEVCSHLTNSIRSTLGSIRLLAQYEGSAQQVSPDARVAFQHIVVTINKLDTWIRDLHVTLSPAQLRRATQQVEPILQDTLALLDPNLKAKELCVDLQPSEDLPAVSIDRVLVEQALVAVITNAIEASPQGGCIRIRTRPGTKGQAVVQIEDEGDGMSEDIKQRAFDAFYTTKPHSTGLGLTVAHVVVTRHGGNIMIETPPDHGTRVTIELPAA